MWRFLAKQLFLFYMFKTKIQKKTCIKFSVSASFRRDSNHNNDYKKFDNIQNNITKLNNNENFKKSSRNLPLNEIYDLQTKRPLFPPPAPPFPFKKPNINIFQKGVILLSNFFTNLENGFYTNFILFYILVFLILNCGVSLALLFNFNLIL